MPSAKRPPTPDRTLTIYVHEDGDDFAWLALLPESVGMTLTELEFRTRDPEGNPRLGSIVRTVIEALRRSGQKQFEFDPSNQDPMCLSDEWVLGARTALEDTIWFLERRNRILDARRKSIRPFELVWEADRTITVKLGEQPPLHLWHCHDCSSNADPFQDVCSTDGCPSHERYVRVTGRPSRVLHLVPPSAPAQAPAASRQRRRGHG